MLLAYVGRRLLQAVPVLLIATFVVFAMVHVLPGDPVRALAGGRRVSEATVAAIEAEYHLDEPLPLAYWAYVSDLASGDLGQTLRGRDTGRLLGQRLPVTLRLAGVTLLVEAILGAVAGILAALQQGRFIDKLVLVSTVAALAIPLFAVAVLLQLAFGVELTWLPVGGVGRGWLSYVLPAAALAAPSLAYVARLLRAELVEVLGQPYITTAQAVGISPGRIVGVYALRNAAIPVVTFLAMDLGALLAGSVIVEGVFDVPGVGQALFEGIRRHDGPLVVTVVTLLIATNVVLNLAADLLYWFLDPQIRDA